MRQSGFTLVEMLIALTIFGMLTAAGVTLLSVSLRTQETADAALGRLEEVRRADLLLAADLAQAVPRLRRDENGERLPAFTGGADGEELLLEFVRGGWENYDDDRRSTLQRVQYRLRGGTLVRLAYPVIDGGGEAIPVPLLTDVGQAHLRYRDKEGGWRERWDPTDISDMPRAVELSVATQSHGTLRQLFLVGAIS